jgi:tRNA(Ile)-lysidine synthetase-like protein
MSGMIEQKVKWPPAGRYVLAVSGGVDSMALLDLMARAVAERNYELTVAHFDHGIRPDSGEDRELVERIAAASRLKCVVSEGRLGARTGEAEARSARHEFLRRVAVCHNSRLVTAHHRDDLLETSLLNLARGSGRRGLAPMADNEVARPLLDVTKAELLNYARERGLEWREDSTNADLSNPRNFLRRVLLSAADTDWQAGYLEQIDRLRVLNDEIDNRLRVLSISRQTARELSLDELAELLLWAARAAAPDIELKARLLAELALFVKTARAGQRRPLRADLWLEIRRENIALTLASRPN